MACREHTCPDPNSPEGKCAADVPESLVPPEQPVAPEPMPVPAPELVPEPEPPAPEIAPVPEPAPEIVPEEEPLPQPEPEPPAQTPEPEPEAEPEAQPETPSAVDAHTINVTFDGSVSPSQRDIVDTGVGIVSRLLSGPATILDIEVTARPLTGFTDDGPGGTLAAAGPDAYGQDGVPVSGQMFLDPADELNVDIVVHEIFHILGVVYIPNTPFGDLVDVETETFTGTRATEAWRAIGQDGHPPLAPAPDLSHWNERIFGQELSTPQLGANDRTFVSEITLGLLADIGYDVTKTTTFDLDDQIIAAALSRVEGCAWCSAA